MDSIHKDKEHNATHHEHHIDRPVDDQQEEQNIEQDSHQPIPKKAWRRLGRFSYLEIVGMVAVAVIVLDQFFAVSITVTRKQLLQKMLGQKAQVLPPQLSNGSQASGQASQQAAPADPALYAEMFPANGTELPVTWGDLGKQMVKSGVIDQQKFEQLYAQQGGMPADIKKMLAESGNGRIKVTEQNASGVLNLLWALGLGNKNEILDQDMKDPKYGGEASKFASTGGWPLSTGTAMDHYGKHQFIRLTAAQQAIVDRTSRNIYRPCCGNSTHFPDCNHGMAMLALLELMASQGVNEQDIYKYALAVNSYWFPNNYLTIASYFKKQGTDWNKVNPQTVLGAQYSSAQGYQQLLQQVAPQQVPQSKGGCGV